MKAVELIYSQGDSLFSYPFKVYYKECNGEGERRFVISVPKKIFKRAVKRNLIRRRIREVFRLQCKELPNIANYDILVVYVSSHILEYGKISETLPQALSKIGAGA